ncbi:MAG: hypothetical protein K5905_12170 [Roseibium sp.]|uniref:hypothetical protein n=1 Tax=Roseibium sp. TaxID=1936156 RepID=UPI002626AE6F|nr:hypothetical protein [Roseibium sp.]MCV0426223.1 hypothetical protein [Roseibium sp.]
MNCSRTFPVLDGAEDIGVVIRTKREFEPYHHVVDYLATYQTAEEAKSAVYVRGRREDAA